MSVRWSVWSVRTRTCSTRPSPTTSGSDGAAEPLVRDAAELLAADVRRLTTGRTVVLITHQLTGLESWDEIVVLDEGRVVARGSHESLLDNSGSYSRLFAEEVRRGMTIR